MGCCASKCDFFSEKTKKCSQVIPPETGKSNLLQRSGDRKLVDIIKFIETGVVDVNFQDVLGETSLVLASQSEHAEPVKDLIETRVASTTKSIACIAALINTRADVNSQDVNEHSPLIQATFNGNQKNVQDLLKSGYWTDLVNKDSNSVIAQEALKGRTGISKDEAISGCTCPRNSQKNNEHNSLMLKSKDQQKQGVDEIILGGGHIYLSDPGERAAENIALTAAIRRSFVAHLEAKQVPPEPSVGILTGTGEVLLCAAPSPFNFNTLAYTAEEASCTHERSSPDCVCFNLDRKPEVAGGDDSWTVCIHPFEVSAHSIIPSGVSRRLSAEVKEACQWFSCWTPNDVDYAKSNICFCL